MEPQFPEPPDPETPAGAESPEESEDSSVSNDHSVSLPLAFFGGGGIGLLFGVIMGTSVTPTVATMLGALTTMLAAILGLNDSHFNDAKATRIGAFGLFCVLGAYLGLYVRSHNLLAPEPLYLKRLYLDAGFSDAQALNFIAIQEFGLSLNQIYQQSGEAPQPVIVTSDEPNNQTETVVPGDSAITTGDEFGNTAASVATAAPLDMSDSMAFKRHSSLLFSAPVEVSGCEELIFTDDSLPLDEIINNYELTSIEWEELVTEVLAQVPDSQHKNVLLATKDSVCAFPDDEIDQCDQVAELLTLNSKDAISKISALNSQWRAIVDDIASFDFQNDGTLMSMRQIHSMLCKEENS